MKVVSMMPEGMQNSVMNVGVRAMRDPHVVGAAMIPAAIFLTFVPHAVRIAVTAVTTSDYPLEEPREQLSSDSSKIAQKYRPLLRRCAACHHNQLEGVTLFAAAVLTAKLFIAKSNKKAARQAATLAVRCVSLLFLFFSVVIFSSTKRRSNRRCRSSFLTYSLAMPQICSRPLCVCGRVHRRSKPRHRSDTIPVLVHCHGLCDEAFQTGDSRVSVPECEEQVWHREKQMCEK